MEKKLTVTEIMAFVAIICTAFVCIVAGTLKNASVLWGLIPVALMVYWIGFCPEYGEVEDKG